MRDMLGTEREVGVQSLPEATAQWQLPQEDRGLLPCFWKRLELEEPWRDPRPLASHAHPDPSQPA